MDAIRITKHVSIPRKEVKFSAALSRGPGGQNVNKVCTKVMLHFDVADSKSLSPAQKQLITRRLGASINKNGILTVACQQTRSQALNRQLAEKRFAQILRQALSVQKKRKLTSVPRREKLRRLQEKRHKGGIKRGRARISLADDTRTT